MSYGAGTTQHKPWLQISNKKPSDVKVAAHGNGGSSTNAEKFLSEVYQRCFQHICFIFLHPRPAPRRPYSASRQRSPVEKVTAGDMPLRPAGWRSSRIPRRILRETSADRIIAFPPAGIFPPTSAGWKLEPDAQPAGIPRQSK